MTPKKPTRRTGLTLARLVRGADCKTTVQSLSPGLQEPLSALRGEREGPWRIGDAPPDRRTHACAARGGRVRWAVPRPGSSAPLTLPSLPPPPAGERVRKRRFVSPDSPATPATGRKQAGRSHGAGEQQPGSAGDVVAAAARRSAGLPDRPLANRPRRSRTPCSPCFIWSRSGIANSYDNPTPVQGADVRKDI